MYGSIVQFEGPERALKLFNIRLVGFDAETGKKILFTLVFIAIVLLLGRLIRWAARTTLHALYHGKKRKRVAFWTQQAIHLFLAVFLIAGLLSIWFNNPARMTTFFGLVTAGLAFALQRVITAFAGYLVILHGDNFNIGDRIVMGGVRGDVIALGFIQTTIMEMGQPPPVQNAPPAMWVQARQYTGRIVTISNAEIFEEPVYNYTRDFPYIWEELTLPVSYKDDRGQVEQILLDAAQRHGEDPHKAGEEHIREMERRYALKVADMVPRVYFRLTDNWLEMTVRFLTTTHGVRNVKDAMSRYIIQALDEANIGIASGTYEIVGMPPLQVSVDGNGQNGRGNSGTEVAKRPDNQRDHYPQQSEERL